MGRVSFSLVLVGPRSMFREGLIRILSAAGFQVAAAGSSLADISPDQVPRHQPILLVIDASKDQAAVLREIELFKRRYPTDRIALLADHEQLSDDEILEAFREGAHAYFAKPNCETFIKCLELVVLGELIVPPQLMSFMLHHQDKQTHQNGFALSGELPNEADNKYAPKLSSREICILRRLISGELNKTIARSQSIAEATVKVHVKAILRKIRVHNRTQAAIWGLNHGIVAGSDNVLEAPITKTDAPVVGGGISEPEISRYNDVAAISMVSNPAGTAAAVLIGRGRSQV